MRPYSRFQTCSLWLTAGLLACTANAGQQAGFSTTVKPYAISISQDYVVKPIISAGDRVPLASNPNKLFQMIGVPDGLGAYKTGGGGAVVFMNHEVGATALSEAIV